MTKEKAIMYLSEYIEGDTDSEIGFPPVVEAIQMGIDALSRPEGEWIIHQNNGIESLECPFCKSWYLHEYLTRNSFCPNCGAKMRKEQ